MTTRRFTRAELTEHGVPPDSPADVETSQTVLHDEHITILKYSQKRLCVFRFDGDGKTYAVEYEAPIDAGDHEIYGGYPDDHGWRDYTIEGTEVRQRATVVYPWVAVDPRDDPGERTVFDRLTTLFEECGVITYGAQQQAAELLHQHAMELRGRA